MAKAGGGLLITGDAELDAALKGLPLAVQKKLSRKATRESAKSIVLPQVLAAEPVDTGELEESTKVKAVPRSRTRFGHMVTVGEGVFQGNTYYSGMLEFGTKERVQKTTGRETGRIEPQKFIFLRPAIYDNKGRIVAKYVDAMKEVIREAGK